jgi:hypothetical protein
MGLVAGVRWVVRGKDAGSVRIRWIRARLRTPHRGAQRGPAAQRLFAKPSWRGGGVAAPSLRSNYLASVITGEVHVSVWPGVFASPSALSAVKRST